MQRYYSPSAGGFFSDDVHGATEARDSSIPEDAVAIDDATWLQLLEATATGKLIVMQGGQPVAIDTEGEA